MLVKVKDAIDRLLTDKTGHISGDLILLQEDIGELLSDAQLRK